MANGKRRTNIILICAAVVVLVLGTVGTWFFFGRSEAPPLPRELIAQTGFPLYYPSTLPDGYTLKAGSASGDSNAVYYTLTDATGKNAITVTLQATPLSFDASKIIGTNPIPTSITPVGTLYNLSTGETSKYMLSTGKTLLFITSPTTIDGKTISAITGSLTEIKTK